MFVSVISKIFSRRKNTIKSNTTRRHLLPAAVLRGGGEMLGRVIQPVPVVPGGMVYRIRAKKGKRKAAAKAWRQLSLAVVDEHLRGRS